MARNSAGRRLALAGFVLLVPALVPGWPASPARADRFPPGNIRIVVPAAPSTPPDIISRVVAAEMTRLQGWTVFVENRPSAGNIVAGVDVLKQPADGTSIFAVGMPLMATPSLFANVPFRLDTDFAPLVKVATSYNVLVVNPSLPAKSVAELVALLKQKPDTFTYSSGGFGTPAHLIGEMFKLLNGVRVTHVPYQQFPQAIADLVAGVNQYMFITMLPVVDLINAGKLRALAVTGPERVAALKDVPTIVEEGFPNLVVEDWVGYSVKAGTPQEVITELNRAVNAALARPNVRDAFAKLGARPDGGTAAEYGNLMKTQSAYWSKVVKDSGITIQK